MKRSLPRGRALAACVALCGVGPVAATAGGCSPGADAGELLAAGPPEAEFGDGVGAAMDFDTSEGLGSPDAAEGPETARGADPEPQPETAGGKPEPSEPAAGDVRDSPPECLQDEDCPSDHLPECELARCVAQACVVEVIDCSTAEDACHTAACLGEGCSVTTLVGAGCDDGNPCTLGDGCSEAGDCFGAWDVELCGCQSEADCASLDGPCFLGRCWLATHACYQDPAPGDACDDGDPCTQGDLCVDDGGCEGSPYACEGLSCQVAACDGLGGCELELAGGTCLIDGDCFLDGDAAPEAACAVCSAGVDAGGWSSAEDGTLCDADGDACTSGDLCVDGGCAAGPALGCDDALDCTADSCSVDGGAAVCTHIILEDHCLVDGVCRAAGEAHPNGACLSCAPVAPLQWSWSADGTACDADDDACTVGDACSSGVCVPGESTDCDDGVPCTWDSCVLTAQGEAACDSTLFGGHCFVEGACLEAGDEQPGQPCLQCRPEVSSVAFSAAVDGTGCNADDTGCTVGDACASGLCKAGPQAPCSDGLPCTANGCIELGTSSYACYVEPAGNQCFIGGACYAAGEPNPAVTGEICDPNTSEVSWTAASTPTPACSQGKLCNKDSDDCGTGSCFGPPGPGPAFCVCP